VGGPVRRLGPTLVDVPRGGHHAWIASSIRLAAVVAATAIVSPLVARADELAFRPVVEHAAFPTNLAFAPDGRAFYTERQTGRIRIIGRSGTVRPAPFATLPVDARNEELGLLGLALHPNFEDDPWAYAYYSGTDGYNHLVRIRAEGDTGGTPENLLTLLSTQSGWHNGGDLAFGPDGDLYVAVGDGHVAERAQRDDSLGGKILRVGDDGSIPRDNPLRPDSPVFATGIRNSFGLCFAPDGALWETENGPTRWDELNRIQAGGDYGWPAHLGPGAAERFVAPAFAWRAEIVPTGCLVQRDGSILVGDFHGDLHRVAFADDDGTLTDTVVATFDHGITDVERAPDGRLYVVTADGIWLRSPSSGGGPLTPIGIVVLAVLTGLLLLARRRLEPR
jgi:glucose/arabinose dehydrogenase